MPGRVRGEDRIRRLRWLCRRGMKELDILLESFLESSQQALHSGDYAQLENFLAQEDDQIWAWIQQLKEPDNPHFRALAEAIRRGA